ncbi:hypothetical protein AVEN_103575-1 [Araneus ventricosus]|uniref:Uncharacterized protein n=1 Tax=Araneus ventricosus TaxID=182803 RepID=A0A4Y2MAE2_ARAVE|nr:hypothetical protein AVEN_103575-1 [Araneus ventricosus]
MPKRKRGVAGDAACRQQAIIKRERRVAATDEERNRDFQLWHKVARTEETEEQNISLLTVVAQHGQKRRADETEEQRNSRLSDMAQRSQERRAEENRRTKEWPIGQTRRVT